MQPFTEQQQRPLKVLNAALAGRLCALNSVARRLQAAGVLIISQDSESSRIVIGHDEAERLAQCLSIQGFAQSASAGSTLYRVVSAGVTIEWRAPISSRPTYAWEVH